MRNIFFYNVVRCFVTLPPAFIEHQAVERLMPLFQSYLLKRLQKPELDKAPFKATKEESYAAKVFERIGELDNAVKSLHLAIHFVTDLESTHQDAPEVYRYHYENFLLRLTGIVDRAHHLVGTSLLLSPSKLERVGANQFVLKSIASDHPELLQCLIKLATVSDKHRASRNKVAHSNAFSTLELGLFSAVVSLNLNVGNKTQIDELMNNYFSESGAELALLITEMVTGIEELLDALAPIYKDLFSGNA